MPIASLDKEFVQFSEILQDCGDYSVMCGAF